MMTAISRILAAGVLAASAALASPVSAQVTYSFTGYSGDEFIIVGAQAFSFTQPSFLNQTSTVTQFTAGNVSSAKFCFPGTVCGFFGVSATDYQLQLTSAGGQAVYTFAGSPFTMNGANIATSGTNAGTLTVSGSPVPTPPVSSAVPEPATWGMMILGVGVIGCATRRRRKITARLIPAA